MRALGESEFIAKSRDWLDIIQDAHKSNCDINTSIIIIPIFDEISSSARSINYCFVLRNGHIRAEASFVVKRTVGIYISRRAGMFGLGDCCWNLLP